MLFGVVSVLLLASASAQTLKQVNILFRHGDRTPTGTFPTNPDKGSWPQGYGQLTTRGMMQHYQTGLYFQKRYIQSIRLLGPDYNREEVVVRSTDVDRALMSVESQLAGWFAPNGSQVWNPDLQWQPIPAHTQPFNTDYLLNMNAECALWDQLWQQENENGSLKAFYDQNKAMLQFIALKSGLPANSSVDDISYLNDILFIQNLYNRTMPTWANSSVLDVLRRAESLVFTVMFNGPAKSRVRGGFTMKEIMNNMDDARRGNTTFKLHLYSAHDVNVAALLSTLQVYDNVLPVYASAVVIELWQAAASSAYTVRVYRKRGANDTSPSLLMLPGCAGDCPIEQFRAILKDYLPTGSFDEECQNPSGSSESSYNLILLIVAAACGGVLVIITTTIISYVLCRRKRKSPYRNIN